MRMGISSVRYIEPRSSALGAVCRLLRWGYWWRLFLAHGRTARFCEVFTSDAHSSLFRRYVPYARGVKNVAPVTSHIFTLTKQIWAALNNIDLTRVVLEKNKIASIKYNHTIDSETFIAEKKD